MKQPVFLNIFACRRSSSKHCDIITINSSLCSVAVAERGFLFMNLVMNDLRGSNNIGILDATMQITYVNVIIDDVVNNNIIGTWKKRGNRRIEL